MSRPIGMLAQVTISRAFALAAIFGVMGCVIHRETPVRPLTGAEAGRAPEGFDAARACGDWRGATSDEAALEHDSFPERDVSTSCFVRVRYDAGIVAVDPTPAGCGYPRGDRTWLAVADAAERYERVAAGIEVAATPIELACALPDHARRRAAWFNARTLRATLDRVEGRAPFPYATASTFGYGNPLQNRSKLVDYLPGDACPTLDEADLAMLSVNVARARRAAEAFHAGVAPIVTVSGGAVHARLVEAFMLEALVACRHGVPETAVLLDPCADHTHTNIRNTGSLVRAIGGRTAYLVTDDGLQSGYLEEWTAFDMIGGSIDQRSLRDFGYLLGSFRRASVGMKAGFWYTPYRFWAEPEGGLGGFTCVP